MKHLKSLNWSGYLIVLILSAIASMTNEMATCFIGWLIPFSIGAILGLFVLIAGKDII